MNHAFGLRQNKPNQTQFQKGRAQLTLGYSGVANMARYFRRIKGMTLVDYRRRYGSK